MYIMYIINSDISVHLHLIRLNHILILENEKLCITYEIEHVNNSAALSDVFLKQSVFPKVYCVAYTQALQHQLHLLTK